MRRILAIAFGILAVGAAGCRRQAAAPTSTPPLVSVEPPRAVRVAVVDLDKAARAHPRWRELNAIIERIKRTEVELMVAPPQPPVPETDLRKALDEEAARLRSTFTKELDALREESRRQLDAYAADVSKELAAKVEAAKAKLVEETTKAIAAKRDELTRQLRASELEIMEEYRYPILNLRVRGEVAALSSEAEARAIARQITALQTERDDRIREKQEETQKAFLEFQKAAEADVNATLQATQTELQTQAQEQVKGKERELRDSLSALAAQREAEFNTRMEARRKALIASAEAQMRGQQGQFVRDVQARAARLQAEIRTLQEQRIRLEDSILAEVKIEVATIAQERQLDVVLTRHVANVSAVDLTPTVVRKLTR
jgi:hypothetical protein